MAENTGFAVLTFAKLFPATPQDVTDALVSVRTRDLRTGVWAYVIDVAGYYKLDQASVLPPAPPNVVPATDGGNWILMLGGGPTGPFPPLSRTLYHDGIQALAPGVGDGSIARPYGTLQEALSFIGLPADLTGALTEWQIISIGGPVVENLLAPARRLIGIEHTGGNDVIGSVTWIDDATLGFGAPFAALGIMGKHVTGKINLSDNGSAAFSLLALGSSIVDDEIDGTAHVAGPVYMLAGPGGTLSKITCPTGVLYDVIDEAFLGDVDIDFYVSILDSVIGDPANARAWTLANPGVGLYTSVFQGPGAGTLTVTGPAGCLRFDATSNFFFKSGPPAGVGALGGAATKIILEDLVP